MSINQVYNELDMHIRNATFVAEAPLGVFLYHTESMLVCLGDYSLVASVFGENILCTMPVGDTQVTKYRRYTWM
jgi:hypothetical protein